MKLLLISILCAMVCPATAVQVQPEWVPADFASVRATLKLGIPERGAVEASYTPKEGFGTLRVGWDAASRAYYYCTSAVIRGRQSDGVSYAGPPRHGQVLDDTRRYPDSDLSVVGCIPGVVLLSILKDPSHVVRTESNVGSVRIVENFPVSAPVLGNGRAAPGFEGAINERTTEIDKDGAVIHLKTVMIRPGDAKPETIFDSVFSYGTDTEGGLRVALESSGFALRSKVYHASPSPDLFKKSRVVTLGVDAALESEVALQREGASIVKKTNDPGHESNTVASSDSTSFNPTLRYRLPFILCGVVVASVGLFAWWRRRLT